MILKLKNINFTAIKVLFFIEDRDVENASVSSKISAGEKSYKYFIGYLYDDNEIKPLHIMVPKTSAYVKSYDGQIKWMYFCLKIITYWANITLFGKK